MAGGSVKPYAAGMRMGAVGAILGALAVAAGAFGAHALRGRVDEGSLTTFQTAAHYHLVHALAMVFAADRGERQGHAAATRAAQLFGVGVVLFSGSLYAVALGGPRMLGAITPFGGVAFIAGWVMLAVSFRDR